MMAGLWWPMLFKDAKEYVKICDACQRVKVPIRKDNMPLRSMMGARAFAKWGIDFVGPINPPAYRTQVQYIIVATDYLKQLPKMMQGLQHVSYMNMYSQDMDCLLKSLVIGGLISLMKSFTIYWMNSW